MPSVGGWLLVTAVCLVFAALAYALLRALMDASQRARRLHEKLIETESALRSAASGDIGEDEE